MGSGTEDTPWRDHEGDDGAGQTRMPTSAVLSTARQIGVCSSDMTAMSHTCIGNDEVYDKICFVEDRVVLSEHTSSSYTVPGSCSTGTHVLFGKYMYRYFQVLSCYEYFVQ